MAAKRFYLLPFVIFLSSCVGGTLSDTKDFEMFPLRGASPAEEKDLKRCLKAAHAAQNQYRKKNGKWARRVKLLPLDADCNNFHLTQSGTPTGFEIRAELRESETAVRWSVNERGIIEEHLDNDSDEFIEF
jgi:hypothetical protein